MLRFSWLLLLATTIPVLAQHPVDSRNTYQRLICVVPVVGSGTPADPRRPMYAPLPPQRGQAPSRTGIIAFTFQLSDDKRSALVEYVARDRSAFQAILADKSSNVRVFQKGKDKREDVLRELRKYKKDFDIDRFGVSVP